MPRDVPPLPCVGRRSFSVAEVKPAPFDYVRAETVRHAVETLAGAGSEAKIIAGGQSLMPMINFRLVKPTMLVDINRIAGLDRVEDKGDHLHFGALIRHHMIASDPLVASHVPILREAMKNVAHMTVRNRGTFCGSVCHADPAAEMPMMILLLNGIVHIVSPTGERSLPARDFLRASLTTDLEPDEMVIGIDVEKLAPGTGWAFEEFSRRPGDFALAALGVTLQRRNGLASGVRIAMMGVEDMAARHHMVEEFLEGSDMTSERITQAVALLCDSIEPLADLAASSDFRRHLAGALAQRVLATAWARAREETAT